MYCSFLKWFSLNCLSEDSVLGHLIYHHDLGEDLFADPGIFKDILLEPLFTTVTSTFSNAPRALEFFSLHNPELRSELHSELVIDSVAKEISGLPWSFGSSLCSWVFLYPLLRQPDNPLFLPVLLRHLPVTGAKVDTIVICRFFLHLVLYRCPDNRLNSQSELPICVLQRRNDSSQFYGNNKVALVNKNLRSFLVED